MLRLTVKKDGSGSYSTISEAINAIPYNTKARIIVGEGIYEEQLFSDKANLELVAEEGKSVVVKQSLSARTILSDGRKRGTFRSYTAFFSGKMLTIEGITFINEAGNAEEAGQAIALYLDVTSSKLKNVKLVSSQDTLFLAPLPKQEREIRGFYGPRCFTRRTKNKVIVEDSYIEGSVDFIFGGATAEFNNCQIVSNGSGYVTAPSTDKDSPGFTFHHCSFFVKDKAAKVYLMRPWRKYAFVTFLDCNFAKEIVFPGFTPWPGREAEAECASFKVVRCSYEGREGEINYSHPNTSSFLDNNSKTVNNENVGRN